MGKQCAVILHAELQQANMIVCVLDSPNLQLGWEEAKVWWLSHLNLWVCVRTLLTTVALKRMFTN